MSKYSGNIVTTGADAGYSVAFDGTGDYLTVPSNVALQLGTGNFSLEFWVYATNFSSTKSWLSNRNGTETNRWGIDSNTSGVFYLYGNGATVVSSASLTANQWVHICVTRASTSANGVRLFVNGVLAAVGTSATDFAADIVSIGASPTGTQPAIGNVSNVRIVKGAIPTEYQTSSTTVGASIFTPPTQLFNITNTSLLTCNSPAIVDQSSNNFTITANGDAKVSTFTPFAGYKTYNPAAGAATPGMWTLSEAMQAAQTRQWNMYDPYFKYTVLALRSGNTDGAQNNTFLDSSSNNFTITRNGGNPGMTQGTFSPFSQTGWSNYFAGTAADHLSASHPNMSATWTIEAWVYRNSSAANQCIVFLNAGSFQGILFYIDSSSYLKVNDGATVLASFTNVAVPVNAWAHVAIVRSGGTTTGYVNGAVAGSNTFTPQTVNAVRIGYYVGADQMLFPGYISNVRIVNGSAVYTSAFTPPTAPLTDVANTTLLTCNSNRFIDTNTQVAAKTITVTGTPSVQAFSPFAPTAAYSAATNGGSGYFDGAGDYLTFSNNTSTNLGTGDFTFEGWVYPSTLSAFNMIFAAGGANNYFALKWGATSSVFGLNAYNGVQDVSSSSLTTPINQWVHFAFVRISGTLYFYINGVAAGSGAFASSFGASTGTATVGFNATYPSQYFINGSMASVRLVKGQGLATGAFTPPTAPVTTSSIGWTGANVTSSITGTVSLLLNFTNAAIFDTSGRLVVETVGNAQASIAQKKYGPTSMYFDGTGDWLNVFSSAALELRSGDFTIEFFINVNAAPSANTTYKLFFPFNHVTGQNRLAFYMNQNTIRVGYFGTDIAASSALTWTTGQWYHVAVVRNGNAWTIYRDGISVATGTNTVTLGTDTGYVIGENLNAYISDYRVTKFARYTGTFTPPTSRIQDQ